MVRVTNAEDRWAGYVARMEADKRAFKIVTGKRT